MHKRFDGNAHRKKKMATIIALTLAFTILVGNQMHSIKSGTLSVDTFKNSANSKNSTDYYQQKPLEIVVDTTLNDEYASDLKPGDNSTADKIGIFDKFENLEIK